MALTREAVERAMKVQEVIVRGLSGELTWLQVADILGRSPRSIRRMRWGSSSAATTACTTAGG